MSFVNKCDICGKIFEPGAPSTSCLNINVWEYDSNGHCDHTRNDVCSACTDRIGYFVNALRAYGSDQVQIRIELKDNSEENME